MRQGDNEYRQRALCALLSTVFCLSTAVTALADDLEQDIQRASRQVELLENKISLVRNQYLEFRDESAERLRFEQRLNDGQVLMLLKDYIRAALVFSELLQQESYRQNPAYAETLFNMGEALFFNKNYIDARRQYLEVIDHPQGRPYRIQCLVRLMQIALNVNDFSAVDEAYQKMARGRSDASPEAEYLWGKTLLLRGRLDEAVQAFARVPAGKPYFLQARYLTGVVLIRQGKLRDALVLYTDLCGQKNRSPEEEQIVELAWLARGRLRHDLGEFAQALDAYQNISHKSAHFDQALLEIAWTYIEQGNRAESQEARAQLFTEALRTLEILEVSTPDSTVVPKTLLLRGHVLEKLGDFERAADVFLQVGRDYGQVRQQLEDLFKAHQDPVAYFNQLAAQSLDQLDLSAYVPPLAAKWLRGGDDMAAAIGVLKDLDTSKRFLQESRDLLTQLNKLLEGEDRINLVPAMKEALKHTLEVENGRVIVESTLAALDERIISEYLSNEEKHAIEEARRQRQQMEEAIAKLPLTGNAFSERQSDLSRKLEEMEEEVYHSMVTVMGIKAQVRAMDQWLASNADQVQGGREAVVAFREELQRSRALAEELEKETNALRVELETEKGLAGMDAETMAQEAGLRQRYAEALAQERKMAEQIQGRLGSEGAARFSQVNQLRLRLERLGPEVTAIRQRIQERVAVEAEKLKHQAQEESGRLEEFQAAWDKLSAESQDLAGRVAYESLRNVSEQFYRLVLEGEVGLLDVAWGRKHQKTRAITELGRKLGAERKLLIEEFKGALEDTN